MHPRKWQASLAICLSMLVSVVMATFVTAPSAVAEPTQSAEIGMPFTGGWGYNVPTKAGCGPASSQTSHPSCHEIYYGNWSIDLHAGEGMQVRLNVGSPSAALSFSWAASTNGACGQRTVINVLVGGLLVGSVYFEHLQNVVKSGPITNGMVVGNVHNWGTCNPGPHIHMEFRNASGFSCYNNLSTSTYTAGFQVPAGASIGRLGKTGSTATKQACAGSVVPAGAYQAAFQANTGQMFTFSASGPANTQQGMAAGTNPAATGLSGGGFEQAFQANTGNLHIFGAAGSANTQQGMAGGTSPSIAGSPKGGYQVAFQANTGQMFTYNSVSGSANTQQGMAGGTSPSIAALTSGGYEMAFQANTGNLFIYGAGGSGDTHQGMAVGTSPSIAASPNGGFRVAFQSNTGQMFIYDSAGGPANTQQGMANGTSPSIAALTTGGYEEAFQANTGNLYIYGDGGAGNTQQGMAARTSPSIAVSAGGGFQVAFQANIGNLFVYDATKGTTNTQQGMAGGTSPSIGAN